MRLFQHVIKLFVRKKQTFSISQHVETHRRASFPARYKNYLSGKSKHSAVTCIQYIPRIAKELQLTMKEYFLLFMHGVRYRDGRGCYNKSDWARVANVCRGTIYKVLNKFKGKNLIGDFVLGRQGSHRDESKFWIQLTNIFQTKVDEFFNTFNKQKPVEKKKETPKTPKNPLEKDISKESLLNLDTSLPNLSFYSADTARSHLLDKWATALYDYFDHDEMSWRHEAPLFDKRLTILYELPLMKLQLLDIAKIIEQAMAKTKAQNPDQLRFMGKFRINLNLILERYRE